MMLHIASTKPQRLLRRDSVVIKLGSGCRTSFDSVTVDCRGCLTSIDIIIIIEDGPCLIIHRFRPGQSQISERVSFTRSH